MEHVFQVIIASVVTLVAGMIGFTFKKVSEDTAANNRERHRNSVYRDHMTENMNEIKTKVDTIMVIQQEERVEHAKIDLRLDDLEARMSKAEEVQREHENLFERRKK